MPQRIHVQKLVERVRLLPALPAALVYPCDSESLQLALSGSFAGYFAPTLVGPQARIRDVAARAGLDISRLPLADTADSPLAAAGTAVALAREGRVAALVKGSMADRDLLAPVAEPQNGLRGATRLSHASFVDLPGLARWLLVTDTLLNITPNLAAKKDILDNTLKLANALGLATPRVALVAGMDVVATALPSTSEAAALKSMAQEGFFPGAVIDGPLLADAALGGDEREGADVLLAPSLECAVTLQRALTGYGRGLACGLVLGARVPVVVSARGDPMETRMASCMLASLMSAHLAALARQASAAQIVPPASARVAA